RPRTIPQREEQLQPDAGASGNCVSVRDARAEGSWAGAASDEYGPRVFGGCGFGDQRNQLGNADRSFPTTGTWISGGTQAGRKRFSRALARALGTEPLCSNTAAGGYKHVCSGGSYVW